VPHSLAVRQAAGKQLARVQEIIEALAERGPDRARGRGLPSEVITALHHIPAREAQWATMPEWVTGGAEMGKGK